MHRSTPMTASTCEEEAPQQTNPSASISNWQNCWRNALMPPRVSRTEVVEAALMSLLQSDQDERMEAALARRLDRLSRQLDRLEWHVELTNEAIGLFVRFWLTSNPPLPDAAMKAAQATGKKRWQGFVESLSRRMEAGPKLRDEIGRENQSGS
jgi:hypothetical protein